MSRPISVLHVIDKLSMDGTNPSSCTFLLRDWASHFDPSQVHLSVCTLRKNDPAGALLENQGTQVHYLGWGKISPKNISAIMNLIDAEAADVAHLHGYSAANFGRIAARRKGISNIVQEHAVLPIRPHQFLVDWLLRKWTDAAIAVSGNVKEFMIRGRSIPSSKIRVIHNGIKLNAFEPNDPGTIRQKRQELRIAEDHCVVGTVTRLRKEKGVEYLIRAIPYILKEISNLILLVIGDGPLRSKLEDLTEKLGISAHVRFLGFRTDVPELLSILHVNVIPSLSEGFPLAFVEAMATGNAIVATRVGGIKEVTQDGQFAHLVAPRNVEQLSTKVTYLLTNTPSALELANRARTAANNYSIEKNVSNLGGIYSELMQKNQNQN